MHLKIGLAAAVFAAVGTFAVADEHQCGDGACNVGQDGTYGAGHYENSTQIRSGTFVDTEKGLATAGIEENIRLLDGKGIYYTFSNKRGEEGFVGVTGLLHDDGVALSTGNCSGLAGESGTNGCNLLD